MRKKKNLTVITGVHIVIITAVITAILVSVLIPGLIHNGYLLGISHFFKKIMNWIFY